MRNIILLIFTAVLLSSCGHQPIEQFHTLKDQTWLYNKPENFIVNIKKPGLYTMLLQIRYTQEYSFSNIWVVLERKSPGGKTEALRVNIPLFDLSGKPFGSFAGKFFDASFPDNQSDTKPFSINFPECGQYSFSLMQNMRNDKLDGIAEIGIRLKEVE